MSNHILKVSHDLIVTPVNKTLQPCNTDLILPDYNKFYSDTEFTQSNKLIVDCVGILTNLDPNHCYYYDYDYLKEDREFHPIYTQLYFNGFNVEYPDLDAITTILGDIEDILEDYKNDNFGQKKLENVMRENDEIQDFLSELKNYKILPEYLSIDKNKQLTLDPPKKFFDFIFFFAFADLFRVGSNQRWFQWLLEQQLSQYRTLRFMSGSHNPKPQSAIDYIYINDQFYEINVNLKDTMYRFPPLKKGLDDQAKTFHLSTGNKLNVEFLFDGINIKKNMSKLREKYQDIFAKYNSQDIFLTRDLDETTIKLYNQILEKFNLESDTPSDTTGTNVSKFIKKIILSHFSDEGYEEKQLTKIINNCLKNTQIESMASADFNDLGIQPFLTVGGLLFSRVVEHPIISGNLSDLDLSSCYSTVMSRINIYLCEPVTVTFPYLNSAPSLRSAIEFLSKLNVPIDGWYIRVTGKLKNAINTLILSDLRFKSKKEKIQKFSDKYNRNPKTIEKFNFEKIGKKGAISTLLTKEIKFGLINHDLLETIKLLPDSWYQEYLDLKVNCISYHPQELLCENIVDYLRVSEQYSNEEGKEVKLDFNTGMGIAYQKLTKKNVGLVMPIKDYWILLKSIRSELKKAKDPLQEIFKLFGNSGYGVLACLYLPTCNLMSSNIITASARSGAWLMTQSLNGFNPITDGTSFNWYKVPIGYKFRDILENNPCYVIKYDDSIQNNIKPQGCNQTWINEHFIDHLANFFDIPSDNYLLQRFGHELKKEEFVDITGNKVETTMFTKYYNTNCGNYIKSLDNCSIYIEDTEYTFDEQSNFIKARSYHSNDNLINWYIQSLNQYTVPHIYEDETIIKLSDGNIIAIGYFRDDLELDQIVHPMGFNTKQYKIMKLVSRSQFNFNDEIQLTHFEKCQDSLSNMSKKLLNKSFWKNFVEKNPLNLQFNTTFEEYWIYGKKHPVGIGFELLSLNNKYNGNLKALRTDINNLIIDGETNFNNTLKINDSILETPEIIKNFLATVIVLRLNANLELKQCLINSCNEPNNPILNRNNVKSLQDNWYVNEQY